VTWSHIPIAKRAAAAGSRGVRPIADRERKRGADEGRDGEQWARAAGADAALGEEVETNPVAWTWTRLQDHGLRRSSQSPLNLE